MTEKKHIHNRWLIGLGIASFCIAAVLLIVFATKGETVSSGAFDEEPKTNFLSCTKVGLIYPFFEYDKSNFKETKIEIIFDQDDLLSTISTTSILQYDDPQLREWSASNNRASINKAFGAEGLDADAFSASFQSNGGKMTFRISADRNALTVDTRKFFLVDEVNEKGTSENYLNLFRKQGFSCNVK